MNKKKPKGRTPSLIGGSLGAPTATTALRKSECKRCKGDILGEESCFEIPQLGGQFTTPRRYCRECFLNILNQTQKDLDELKSL